jgi:hypothetical protein
LIKEFIEVLFLSFYTKDVNLLKNWIIKILEKMHFKMHKKFFYILKVIILKYYYYFNFLGCLGFCLRVRGKISLGGGSKTRSFWIKVGNFSLSKKKLKINYSLDNVRTFSGILGLEIILSYI